MLQMDLFGGEAVALAPSQPKTTERKKITDSLALTERIPDDALYQLEIATVDRGVVKLKPELPRDIYVACDEVLKRLRGKWERRAGGHVFPFPAETTEALFRSVVESGLMPAKNPLALFATPLHVVEEMVLYDIAERLDWWEENRDTYSLRQLRMLEPSAGTGAIASYARERWPSLEITCVEQDPINVELLHALGFADVHHADFAEWDPEHDYDIVLMNPPFSVGGKDCFQDHVTKAFSHLRKDGLLAAVVPTGWTWKSDSVNMAFLNYVATHGCWWELPKQSFKESGTTIDTMVVLLDYKPEIDAHRHKEYNGYRNYDEWLLRLHCDCDGEYYKWEWRQLEKIRKGEMPCDFTGLPTSQNVLDRWRSQVETVRQKANRAGDGFVLSNLDIDTLIAEQISDHLSTYQEFQ